jgi:hypothetical protein
MIASVYTSTRIGLSASRVSRARSIATIHRTAVSQSTCSALTGPAISTSYSLVQNMGSTQRFSPRSSRIRGHIVPNQPRWPPSRPATPCAKRRNRAPVALGAHAADQESEAVVGQLDCSHPAVAVATDRFARRALKRQQAKRWRELQRCRRATRQGSIRTRRAVPPPPQRSSCLSTTLLSNACIIKGSPDDFATRGHLLQSEGLEDTGRMRRVLHKAVH